MGEQPIFQDKKFRVGPPALSLPDQNWHTSCQRQGLFDELPKAAAMEPIPNLNLPPHPCPAQGLVQWRDVEPDDPTRAAVAPPFASFQSVGINPLELVTSSPGGDAPPVSVCPGRAGPRLRRLLSR